MQNLADAYADLQPLSHLTVPALPNKHKPTTPQSPNGASSPYTGEPIWVCADLSGCPYTGEPMGTHKPKPPLCKAPEAAVQRRCGDRVSGGRVVNYCTKPQVSADLQPLSHLTAPAPLTQGSLSKYAQTSFSGTNKSLPCVRRRKLPCSGGVGTALAVEGLSPPLCKGTCGCRSLHKT